MVTLLEREKEATKALNIQMYIDVLREKNIPIKITDIPQKADCYKISFTRPIPATQVLKISSELKNLGCTNAVYTTHRSTLAHLRKRRFSDNGSFYIIVRAKTDIPNEPRNPILLPPPKPVKTTHTHSKRRSVSRKQRR